MSSARDPPAKSPKFEASIVPIYTTPPKRHSCRGPGAADEFESQYSSESLRCIAPLQYRSLQDSANKKYLSAPGVVQHLIKQGLIDVDGTAVPSRDDEHHLSQIRKVVKERKEIVRKLQEKDEARLRRLQDAARVNELIYTSNGIYEIDAYRRPVQRLVRDETGPGPGELVKPKKASKKKKRKRPFRVEKEKGKNEALDTYILYPSSPNDSFLDVPISRYPGQLDESESDGGDFLTPSPDPLHFHLPASNLDKASACIKDGILSRDIPRPREGGSAGPTKRRKKRASQKRHVEADVVRKSKSAQLIYSSSRRGMGSRQGDGMKLVDDDAEIYNRKNASKLLPELVPRQVKSMSTFRKTAGDSYFDNLKVHNSRWSRKHDLANAIKRVKDKYGGSILSDDSSSRTRRDHSTSSSKLNTATKSVQHSDSDLYETTDSAIQTREDEVQREDLLELLRELVMTPRQYLDAVMEMIEKELCQPYVSYSRMLKQVLQYSAIEKDVANGELNDQILLPYEYQIDNQRSLELPRPPGQYPPYLRGSSPVLASLARHVVEDFMFDQNIPSGATASKGMAGAGLRRSEATNYDIVHGAHGLHTSISFQPSQTLLMDKNEDLSVKSSESLHSPSNASCHFNKVSGEIYHMYLRKDGSSYFSMLSPKERGVSCHSSYLGSYKENKDDKMTLVATPSSLSLKAPSESDLSDCESSSSLDDASCSVGRVPGFNYYKYRKEDGSSFLTTVSPKTWGESCPHSFVKVYRESKSGTSTLAPVKTESGTTVQVSNTKSKSELELGPTNTSSSSNKSSELADDLYRSEHTDLSDSTREEVPMERQGTPLPLLPVLANEFVSHSISGPAALPRQARSTEDAETDALTRAFSSVECSFPRSPGKVYHLYKRRNGSTFLSTLPPQEVHEFVQDTFVASYIQGTQVGKMTLVEQKEDPSKIVPKIIYCAENQEFTSNSCNSMVPGLSEQEVIERPSSREFVDALLQVSQHQFLQNEKSWIDEFLTDKEENGNGGSTKQELQKKGPKKESVTRSRSLNSNQSKSPTKLQRRDHTCY